MLNEDTVVELSLALVISQASQNTAKSIPDLSLALILHKLDNDCKDMQMVSRYAYACYDIINVESENGAVPKGSLPDPSSLPRTKRGCRGMVKVGLPRKRCKGNHT